MPMSKLMGEGLKLLRVRATPTRTCGFWACVTVPTAAQGIAPGHAAGKRSSFSKLTSELLVHGDVKIITFGPGRGAPWAVVCPYRA